MDELGVRSVVVEKPYPDALDAHSNSSGVPMTRRGRPRKFNAQRTASGRVKPEAILPTPELLAKKAFLTGPGDPALSTNALDILRARGFISDDQLRAGANFRRDLVKAYGSIGPAQRGDGPRGHDGDESDADQRARLRAQENVGKIRKACPSYNAYKRLRNLCAYHETPTLDLVMGDPSAKGWRPNKAQEEVFGVLEAAAAVYGIAVARAA